MFFALDQEKAEYHRKNLCKLNRASPYLSTNQSVETMTLNSLVTINNVWFFVCLFSPYLNPPTEAIRGRSLSMSYM